MVPDFRRGDVWMPLYPVVGSNRQVRGRLLKSGMSVRPEDGTEKDIYGQTLIISAFLKNNFNGVGRLYCDKGAKMRKKGDINPAVDKFHRELGIQAPKMRF